MHISIVMIGLAVHFQYVSDSHQPRNCLKMEMKSKYYERTLLMTIMARICYLF